MFWDNEVSNYTVIEYKDYDVLTITKKQHNGAGPKPYDPDMIGDKHRQSLSRSKRNIGEILRYNLVPNSLMVTLTYADNMQCYDKARKDFQYWIKLIGKPKYLRITELQQRGAIHFHVILFDFIDIQLVEKSWQKNGYSFSKVISDMSGVNSITNYLAKYVSNTEKGQMIAKDKKLYTTSRDVLRPVKRKGTAKDLYNFANGLRVVKGTMIKYIIPKV